ncbi:MAG: polysaccharide deacetylase family protein [Magnetococcales bacterium]|nr:polysaccharide deacetylase family protein [Magnetococcales bacterium]
MKSTLIALARRFHLLAMSRPLPEKIAIYFHAIAPNELGALASCLHHFRSLGYSSTTPDHWHESDGKSLFVSFDDNYHSWLALLPLLQQSGIQATFYVNTLPIADEADPRTITDYFERIEHHGDRQSLSAAEIRQLAQAGHTIACHSHSHKNLNAIPHTEALRDITTAKERLEAIVDHPVQHLSFPFGMRRHFNEKLLQWSLTHGFQSVAYAIPGMQFSKPRPGIIHRTRWHPNHPLEHNIADLRVDGRLFAALTGRSPVG